MRTIAFFSFKGGVGRTALLLNLATWWAGRGRVVAVMDLDLTAPGLSYSPLAGGWLHEEGLGFGMADLLAAYQQGRPGEGGTFDFLPPHLLLRDLGPSRDEGRLFLIGAGARPYVETRARDHGPIPPLLSRPLPADAAPEDRAFASLAGAICEDLSAWRVPEGPCAGRPIDYLLVDTRTGFAELVGLGLGLLADQRVLVSGLNEQNLHGLRLTLEEVLPTIPLDTLPVALTLVFSPLPAAEDEALLRRLEEAKRQVGETLRYTSAGGREQPPPTFHLHYTPLLALGDIPLVDRYPRLLYAQEVEAIGAHLEGAVGLGTDTEEAQARARREAQRIIAPTLPLPPPERTDSTRPHPFADLPAWHWPLTALGRGAEAEARLAALVRPGPAVQLDRAGFADLLAWSHSYGEEEADDRRPWWRRMLGLGDGVDAGQRDPRRRGSDPMDDLPDEFFRNLPWREAPSRHSAAGKKRDTLARVPDLGQDRLDRLVALLREERPRLLARWGDESARRRLAGETVAIMADWAGLVLDDPQRAAAALTAPLGDPGVLPHWQPWPEFWQALALWLLRNADRPDAAMEALDRAVGTGGEPAGVAEDLLEWLETGSLSPKVLTTVEEKVRGLAPAETWLNYRLARLWLGCTPPDQERAGALLAPLLAEPPADWDRCLDLLRMVGESLPDLAADTERTVRLIFTLPQDGDSAWNDIGWLLLNRLARYEDAELAYLKSIALNPKSALPWNQLGYLYVVHLARYEESEAAYRKAIELNPKYAHPWNGLGTLYVEHLARYEESEAAYRKAIELDPKFAYPWNGLGYLYLMHLARYEESEAAYRKSIELDPKFAYPWNGLGYLYLTHLARYEESEAAYRKAIEIDPRFASAWSNLGYLLLHVRGDCPGAAAAFERGVGGTAPEDADSARLNLAHTRLRQGQPEAARRLAREALDGFLSRPRFDAQALRLALELADDAQADRQAARAREHWGRTRHPWTAAALLLHACCHPDREDPESAWGRLADALSSHIDRYFTLDWLHLLAGLHPEAREAARTFARRLLDPAPDLTARCQDVPAPDSMWERFRPFVEGRSGGAGDPADGFCAGPPGPTA